VPDDNLNSGFFNKRTKKYGSIKRPYMRGVHNIPRIKILKRNETLSHTLKNMLGITSSGNDNPDLEMNSNQEYKLADIQILENNHLEDIIHDNYNDKCKLEESVSISECEGKKETLEEDNNSNHNNKEISCQKVILVQRRNTIGFIEFMRGKYDVDNHEYIVKLFNMLTFDEKRILREYDSFDTIRKIIGLGREYNYKKEYDDSKIKFETLRNHVNGNMIFKLLDKSFTKWNSPEWGLPKGRRGSKEFDIECAIREFVEETGIKSRNLIVYRNVKPLEEEYTGINGVVYKHIYYLAVLKDTEDARLNIDVVERGGQVNFEVSNVKTFGLSECHRIIRPYYVSKLNVIKKGFQLIHCIDQFFE
jgi:8-oxo-dGTP pyrophosphatase MutT (NUDIX family)